LHIRHKESGIIQVIRKTHTKVKKREEKHGKTYILREEPPQFIVLAFPEGVWVLCWYLFFINRFYENVGCVSLFSSQKAWD